MATVTPQTYFQVYTPVTHRDGRKLVQVSDGNGTLLGWADGREKFDITGEWTIDETWSPEQSGQFGHRVEVDRGFGRVVVKEHDDRISRVIEITI